MIQESIKGDREDDPSKRVNISRLVDANFGSESRDGAQEGPQFSREANI